MITSDQLTVDPANRFLFCCRRSSPNLQPLRNLSIRQGLFGFVNRIFQNPVRYHHVHPGNPGSNHDVTSAMTPSRPSFRDIETQGILSSTWDPWGTRRSIESIRLGDVWKWGITWKKAVLRGERSWPSKFGVSCSKKTIWWLKHPCKTKRFWHKNWKFWWNGSIKHHAVGSGDYKGGRTELYGFAYKYAAVPQNLSWFIGSSNPISRLLLQSQKKSRKPTQVAMVFAMVYGKSQLEVVFSSY